VVTPRTLAEFRGTTLILPDVREWVDHEKDGIEQYLKQGNQLIVTGEDTLHLGGRPNVTRFPECPGKIYNALLEKDFDDANPAAQRPFLDSLQPSLTRPNRGVEVIASPSVATSVAQVKGLTHVFLANFAGLVAGANPIQTPQTDVKISLPAVPGNAGYFLPFLGNVQRLQGTQKDGRETFVLPAISKGGVFWYAR